MEENPKTVMVGPSPRRWAISDCATLFFNRSICSYIACWFIDPTAASSAANFRLTSARRDTISACAQQYATSSRTGRSGGGSRLTRGAVQCGVLILPPARQVGQLPQQHALGSAAAAHVTRSAGATQGVKRAGGAYAGRRRHHLAHGRRLTGAQRVRLLGWREGRVGRGLRLALLDQPAGRLLDVRRRCIA